MTPSAFKAAHVDNVPGDWTRHQLAIEDETEHVKVVCKKLLTLVNIARGSVDLLRPWRLGISD